MEKVTNRADVFPQTFARQHRFQGIQSGIVFSVGLKALNLKEMQRVSVILALGLIGSIVMGAERQSSVPEKKVAKKACVGYTIIEASKGIDCNGDTIKLVRTAGFYERVRNDDPS